MKATALICAGLLLASCTAPEYSSPAWSGRVIERETGAPLEGAIVVVRWPLETFHSDFAGWLLMDEAVSDRDGIFHFKAWGPMRTPDKQGSRTRLNPNVPEISVFKSGYEIVASEAGSDTGYLDDRFYTGPSMRPVYANEKVIALGRFKGSDGQYRDYLDRLLSIGGPTCDYQLIPRMFAAVVTEDRRLRKITGSGIRNHSLEEIQRYHSGAECTATAIDAIGQYLQ